MIHYTCMKEAWKTESPIMVMRTTRTGWVSSLWGLQRVDWGLWFLGLVWGFELENLGFEVKILGFHKLNLGFQTWILGFGCQKGVWKTKNARYACRGFSTVDWGLWFLGSFWGLKFKICGLKFKICGFNHEIWGLCAKNWGLDTKSARHACQGFTICRLNTPLRQQAWVGSPMLSPTPPFPLSTR